MSWITNQIRCVENVLWFPVPPLGWERWVLVVTASVIILSNIKEKYCGLFNINLTYIDYPEIWNTAFPSIIEWVEILLPSFMIKWYDQELFYVRKWVWSSGNLWNIMYCGFNKYIIVKLILIIFWNLVIDVTFYCNCQIDINIF